MGRITIGVNMIEMTKRCKDCGEFKVFILELEDILVGCDLQETLVCVDCLEQRFRKSELGDDNPNTGTA